MYLHVSTHQSHQLTPLASPKFSETSPFRPRMLRVARVRRPNHSLPMSKSLWRLARPVFLLSDLPRSFGGGIISRASLARWQSLLMSDARTACRESHNSPLGQSAHLPPQTRSERRAQSRMRAAQESPSEFRCRSGAEKGFRWECWRFLGAWSFFSSHLRWNLH